MSKSSACVQMGDVDGTDGILPAMHPDFSIGMQAGCCPSLFLPALNI